MSDDLPELRFEGLQQLREQLDEVDERLIDSIAQRQRLVAEIGALKSQSGHQTRDFKREKIVLDKARNSAARHGTDPELAESVLKSLIRASLQSQEQARVQSDGQGTGKRVLVVGGAGRMGRWFADFFYSQGFEVSIADPQADQALDGHFCDLAAAGTDYDILVLATTLALTAEILDELALIRPDALVFDVGSLKSPLKSGLRALADAGVRVTSIHPMFGPSTQLLAGRQIIFVDVGDTDAMHAARELFSATMATCIDMDIDAHDRMIAYVLGLSHLSNIAFIDALTDSGIDAATMMSMSSPTFDAQLKMGTTVVHENPHLYFEIQQLNEFGMQPLDGLLRSVEKLRKAVAEGDQQAFVDAMYAGRHYLDQPDEPHE
ncbi:MAG: bifunctional chorismate mutase/prephenate dehydrogenase [Pseudomonadota bacterium]